MTRATPSLSNSGSLSQLEAGSRPRVAPESSGARLRLIPGYAGAVPRECLAVDDRRAREFARPVELDGAA